MNTIRIIPTAFAFAACSLFACGGPAGADGSASAEAHDEVQATQVSPQARNQSHDQIELDLFPNKKFLPCFAAFPNDPWRQPAARCAE